MIALRSHALPGWVWLPVLIVLCGLGARAPLVWHSRPFDVDEALYASFAREISHENNPLLLGSLVDKPPLGFYVTALSFKLFTSPSEWAARLPGFFASILSLAVLWSLARQLYRNRLVAALATLFLALSPFDIAFSGTAFLDPQLTLWLLLACATIVRGRWAWAGVFTGLAFATKQSALLFIPLVPMLGLIASRGRVRRKQLASFLLVALVSCLLPFVWGEARGPDSSDWWALGTANNTPGRLIRSDEVVPRALAWLGYLGNAASLPLLVALLATGPAVLLTEIGRNPRSRETAIDVALTTYGLGAMLVLWLVAFNLYARYIHPLVPLVGLLLARAMAGWVALFKPGHRQRLGPLLAGVLLVAMGPQVLPARAGDTLLNASRQRYAGMAQVAAHLNAQPPGTIVYDHWLGWPLRWYTGQQRPQDMWLRVVYHPTPQAMAADALRQPDPLPRYFVAPDWAGADPWLRALTEAGFRPQPVAQAGNLTLYRLEPP